MKKDFFMQFKQDVPEEMKDPEMSEGLVEALSCFVKKMVIAMLSISF
jgi:hypothetical protein